LERNDTYSFGGGAPSRWSYAESRLDELNGTERLVAAIEAAVDLRHYLDSDFQVASPVDYLNKYLAFDGFELVLAQDL